MFVGISFVSKTLIFTTEKSVEDNNVDKGTYSNVIDSAKTATENISVAGRAKVEVYNGISVSEASIELNLAGRGLTGSLKAEIRHLTSLEVLNISDNEFTGLPAEVGQLSNLKILNLSGNPFTGLPYELGNLQKLETLDLRNTSYSKQDLEIIKSKLPKTTAILVD